MSLKFSKPSFLQYTKLLFNAENIDASFMTKISFNSKFNFSSLSAINIKGLPCLIILNLKYNKSILNLLFNAENIDVFMTRVIWCGMYLP